MLKIHNRHQHNTDDGGQAIGEELRYVVPMRYAAEACRRFGFI